VCQNLPRGRARLRQPVMRVWRLARTAWTARNHLKGIVDEVQMGDVLAYITVRMGDSVIESVITRRSAEELGLKKGDSVTAVVKATEVMISKP
jgi:molybdopterin-binding protein